MIPVDLNRLREAQSGRMAIPERNMVRRDAVDAVLDAPTVWWCVEVQRGYSVVWHNMDAAAASEICHKAEGCGWVALVPVKGES